MPRPRKIPAPPDRKMKWHSIFAPDKGLKYDLPNSLINEKNTQHAEEVTLREGVVKKATGTTHFASTDTKPLAGTVMLIDQFFKSNGTDRLIVFTTERVYAYNTTTEIFDDISSSGTSLVCQVTVTS